MGGTVRPSAAWRARTRATPPCQSTVLAKKRAWLGRRRLTLMNSEKKMRRPKLRRVVADIWIAMRAIVSFQCSRRLSGIGWLRSLPRAGLAVQTDFASASALQHQKGGIPSLLT